MGQKSFRRKIGFLIADKKNKIHAAKLKQKQFVATFQKAVRLIVVIGQAFSLMPVTGVWNEDADKVRFVRTSWKCVYSFLSVIGQCFMAVLCVNKLTYSPVTLNETSPTIYYVTSVVTMILFARMGRRWPALAQHIAKCEEIDPNYDVNLIKKCNVTCTVVLLLALFEHILSLLSAFAGAATCHGDKGMYEGFVSHFYPWVFNRLSYTPLLGFVTQFLHFQSTFIWNYSDLFVINMSYYLTSRLEQVNKKLLAAQGKFLPEIFWRTIREDYCRATKIVRKVDDVISGIVFISFANNLFYVCLQLYNTLEDGFKGAGANCNSKQKKIVSGPLGGHEAATYFLFSLVYLLSRAISVSLIASQVNTASSVPARILYDVPSPVYCVEVQRFLDQVNGSRVALSGLQFFLVTRGLLLTVAGTIVTYELVMFQFSRSPSSAVTTLPNVTSTIITSIEFDNMTTISVP